MPALTVEQQRISLLLHEAHEAIPCNAVNYEMAALALRHS
jgi:hypothetical protein